MKAIWLNKLWINFIPPKFSVFGWRLLHGRVSTAQNLLQRNIIPAPVCVSCIVGAVENDDSLFLKYTMAEKYLVLVIRVDEDKFQGL